LGIELGDLFTEEGRTGLADTNPQPHLPEEIPSVSRRVIAQYDYVDERSQSPGTRRLPNPCTISPLRQHRFAPAQPHPK
jgi:hypothetical protein